MLVKGKSKDKVQPRTGHEGPEGEYRYGSTLSLTSALDGCSTPRPGRFTLGTDPVPTVWEAGYAPGPVWTGAENLASTATRSPDLPARSESLYRLSYPGQQADQYFYRMPRLKFIIAIPSLLRLC